MIYPQTGNMSDADLFEAIPMPKDKHGVAIHRSDHANVHEIRREHDGDVSTVKQNVYAGSCKLIILPRRSTKSSPMLMKLRRKMSGTLQK